MEKSLQHLGSLWAGILLASLSPAVSLPVTTMLSSDGSSSNNMTMSLSLVIAIPIATVATFFIGLLYVLILRDRGSLSWFSVCLGTSLMGAPIFYCLQAMFSQASTQWSSSWSYGFVSGLIAGLAF